MKWRSERLAVLVICFLPALFLAACGGSAGEPVNDISVEAPAPTAVVEAAPSLAAPEPAAVTEQLSPTATSNSELEEAFAAATETARHIEETRVTAELTRVFEALAAEEALAPIKAELAALGIDPNQGELGFTHPPISLQVDDPEQSDFANRSALTVVQDFVIAADITWAPNSTESGCGFVVRSDGDEEAPNHYIISLNQTGDGHVLFAEQVTGEVDLSDTTDIAAGSNDPLFNNQSGGTNRLLVVGRGQEFTIYSNGTRLRTVSGKAGFDEGFVAFVAINQSGGISCDFNNAWVWKLE